MTRSIEELAESARRMTDGDVVVSLDTELIDNSFVVDRIDHDDDDYARLRDAIAGEGQSTPILVRPHPKRAGRYMIVYGHRRVRVAKELERKVKAIVKDLDDIAHVVAQGQENSARANLSFIEKALFAKTLLGSGQTKDTIQKALSIDNSVVPHALDCRHNSAPASFRPSARQRASAATAGRIFKKLLASPARAQLAEEIVRSDDFRPLEGTPRFDNLLSEVKAGSKAGIQKPAQSLHWATEDKAVEAKYSRSGPTFNLSLTAREGGDFGKFISSNLDRLYAEFRKANPATSNGGRRSRVAARPLRAGNNLQEITRQKKRAPRTNVPEAPFSG